MKLVKPPNQGLTGTNFVVTPFNPALQDYAYWASAEQFFWPVGLTWSE
ncbi:MAG: hypothetical protein MK434_02625 [SAR324 cluster bacterium]|nr:hypothetical protein [SAR324 cluster bacterium]